MPQKFTALIILILNLLLLSLGCSTPREPNRKPGILAPPIYEVGVDDSMLVDQDKD